MRQFLTVAMLAVFTLASAGVLESSCGNREPPPPFVQPGSATVPPSGPATTPVPTATAQPSASPTGSASWSQLSETSRCEALAPAACVGFFGFRVRPDGSFAAGPTASGQLAAGQITDAELAQLAQDVDSWVAADGSSTASCRSGSAGAPGTGDQVDLTEASSGTSVTVYTAHGTMGRVCTYGDPKGALLLYADMHRLALKYYVVPFT